VYDSALVYLVAAYCWCTLYAIVLCGSTAAVLLLISGGQVVSLTSVTAL
jgi:hypothetical protein